MSAISEAAHDEDESLACESEKCHWRHLLTDQMRETLQDANFSAGKFLMIFSLIMMVVVALRTFSCLPRL